jgi:hypothetical protein
MLHDEEHDSETTWAICGEANDIRWIVFRYFNVLLRVPPSQRQLLTSCVNQARWISQSIHPYISIKRVFYAGVSEARNGAEAAGDP